jgi:hypothetical protein
VPRIQALLSANPPSGARITALATGGPVQDGTASARQTAEQFLAAAAVGKTAKAAAMTNPNSAVAHQLGDFAKIEGIGKATITGCFERGDTGLAMTSDLTVGSGLQQVKQMVIGLVRQRGLWVVDDIDLESQEGARRKLGSFLTRDDKQTPCAAIAGAFVAALAAGDKGSALKLASKDFDERQVPKLLELVKSTDALKRGQPYGVTLYAKSARVIFWPASATAPYLYVTLTQLDAEPGSWTVTGMDLVADREAADRLLMPAGASPAPAATDTAKPAPAAGN